jgi:hypothetical protein
MKEGIAQEKSFGLKPKHWTLHGNDVKQQLQQVLTPNKFLHTTYLAKDQQVQTTIIK